MSFKEKVNMGDVSDATVIRGASMSDTTSISGYYTVECHDAKNRLKWVDDIHNLVTTIGKNKTMDTVLGNVAGGAIFMGLKGTGTAAVGDTQASHAGWLEVGATNAPTFTSPRPTPAFSAASAGAKATSSAVVFAMTGAGTVAGCFVNIGGTSAIDNTTGTLFSAGDFTAGSKTVTNGDSLSVTYTATAA